MREGDVSLRAKIAELVFERVRFKLLKRALCCCSTSRLRGFLITHSIDSSSIDLSSLLHDYEAKLNWNMAPLQLS